MKFEDTHGGYGGKTLIQKIRDRADAAYDGWMDPNVDQNETDLRQGRIEGLCEALGILCSTKEELQWDSTEARYQDRQRTK